ncbi:MAG: hypothetical protein ACOX29_02805 [Bacillota bacterium]|jgi:vacuolar-type H+-ATPase subunit H|nr:hypothetical protein [Bacillota bacterium]HOJ46594.1 hypothetical protein [Bacillota bacterium]HPQ11347.1 hypothetical protein [Bacillota bacterium]HPT61909.1 hypothetical protein [Bacillota bacterium]HPZ73297.1 hypothetical protein [Bacillota bacterium]
MSTVEDKLNELEVYLKSAKELPLTDMVLIDPEKVFKLIQEIRDTLPEEIKQAEEVLKESEKIIADAKNKAQNEYLVAVARNEAILKDTDVVREAQSKKEQILKEAEKEAKFYVDSTLEWIDSKFLEMQKILEQNLEATKLGRSELKRFKIQR